MHTVESPDRASGRGLREVVARMRPLGPAVMTWMNRGQERRRAQEMAELGVPPLGPVAEIMDETRELCAAYERLHPEHAFLWKRAVELMEAHAHGMRAGLEVVERWGFVEDPSRGVAAPEWWQGRVTVPLEFMDYVPENYPDEAILAAGLAPERFHALARRASDRAWIGYYRAKGCLISGGVSLLIKDVTDAALALRALVQPPTAGPTLIYVIGISEDEVMALRRPDACIIGFNRGISPVVERLVQRGDITRLRAEGAGPSGPGWLVHADTGAPFAPVAGGCFVCVGDVKYGLPVADATGIVMTNYTLHHNSFDDQAVMIREMHRIALPAKGGGRAWIAGEMIRNAHFIPTLFGPVSTVGPTLWDAWVSFANGIATVEHLEQQAEAWADEGIQLHFRQVPEGLVGAPNLVQRLLMPPTKMLVAGC